MAEQQDELKVAVDAITQLRGSDDPLVKAIAALASVSLKTAETNGALVDVLSKASKDDDDEGDEDEGDDETDDGEGDDDTDDGEAGYEDMSKASDDDMLDVTEDVQELRKAVAEQGQKIDDLMSTLQAVSEQMAVLATMDKGLFSHVDELFKAQAGATLQLAKAMTDTQTALSKTAVPGITPAFTTPQPAPTEPRKLEAPDAPGEFFIGGSEEAERRKLFKAAARGLITREQYAAFSDPLGSRVFDVDPTVHSSLRAKVAEIPA